MITLVVALAAHSLSVLFFFLIFCVCPTAFCSLIASFLTSSQGLFYQLLTTAS